MIDIYKLEGRRIFSKHPLDRLKRWYFRRSDRILYTALTIIVLKEIVLWLLPKLKELSTLLS